MLKNDLNLKIVISKTVLRLKSEYKFIKINKRLEIIKN